MQAVSRVQCAGRHAPSLRHAFNVAHRLHPGRVQAAAGAKPQAQASETAAIAAFQAAVGDEGVQACVQLLQTAATDKSVKPELVEGALAYLEQQHAPSVRPAASPAADVSGTWRLVFSTATSSRMFQYIPVQEDFVIQPDTSYCALESVVGPARFIISGSIRSWDAATGALSFQFTAVDILLFGNKVWRVTPTTKPKTYTFFYDNGVIAAARSSTGGLALLRK